jgi:hypothetical protein
MVLRGQHSFRESYDTVSLAMKSLVCFFEDEMRQRNKNKKKITYSGKELLEFLDGFQDLVCLTLDESSATYKPKDRDWIKESVS